MMLTLLLASMLTLAYNSQQARAGETIYIMTDGSVEPPTAPIQRDGDFYTLTDDIYDWIVVERNNMTLDGAGKSLRGAGSGYGIFLSGINNVTIKDLEVKDFDTGIAFFSCSNCTVSGNDITNNDFEGILLSDSSDNTISGNRMSNSTQAAIDLHGSGDPQLCKNNTIHGNDLHSNYNGLALYYSSYNTVSQNNITKGQNMGILSVGIRLIVSVNNTIAENTVADNGYGLGFYTYSDNNTIVGNTVANSTWYGVYFGSYSSNNQVYHNNIVNNTVQALCEDQPSIWDDGYPSGGNYWSNYNGTDLFSGPYQNISGSDGIGDIPYIIDQNNRDNYPIANPPSPVHDIAVLDVVLSKTVVGQGYNTRINVTVANQGNCNEAFNLTLYANSELTINETGLAGYWKFDEDSGTAAYDSTGNGNDGVIYGSSWASGHNGSALSFDGVDDYVEVLDSSTLNPPLITVMAWVNFKGFPAPGLYEWRNSIIISKGTNVPTNGHYCLFAQTVDKTRIYFQITEMGWWSWVGGNTNIVEGKWYHLAGTYDGSVLRVYVNGVLEGEQTVNVARTSNSENLQIGALRQPGWEYWANGTIDEVKIYNRALSEREILAHATKCAEIGRKAVTLSDGDSATVAFTWNTSGFAKGNYIMSARADPVSGEIDITDNTCVGDAVLVTIAGDINGDHLVDVHDLHSFGKLFNATPLDPLWVAEADINDDLIIDAEDLRIINTHYGQSW